MATGRRLSASDCSTAHARAFRRAGGHGDELNGTDVSTRSSSFSSTRRFVALVAVPLLLAVAGCSDQAPSPSDQLADDPTIDDGDVGGHDEVEGTAMCVPGVTDCVDVAVEPAGDQMVPPDIDRVDALPAGVVTAEMSAAADAEVFPLFIQQAVVTDTRLQLVVSQSAPPCVVTDHVTTTEADDEVVVTVYARSDAPTDVDCSTVAPVQQVVEVHLGAPLGDRTLLDGSRIVPAE